jgi:hypothetical protein
VDLDGTGEEFIDFGLHEWHFKDLLDGWTFVGVFDEHFREKFLEILRVDFWQRRVGPLENLLDESLHVLSIKGVVESGDLVEDATQTPNV